MSKRERPILLVEDSQDAAELAIRALRQAGMSGPIDVVNDGEEALEYLLDKGKDNLLPFLVLLDINLPKLDGFEVLRQLRQNTQTHSLFIVMFSSSDVRQDIERAYDLGANSYVRKPMGFSKYLETVRQVGQYWLHVNETI